MASYFDEHDCAPLGDHETPDNHLLLARLLIDSGIATALDMNNDLFMANGGHNLPPPTSKSWLANEFPKHLFSESKKVGYKCPICLIEFQNNDTENSVGVDTEVKNAVELPQCNHSFHRECLIKWLQHSSTCPLCRNDNLPTDDPNYEEFKRQKKRKQIRELELAALHDSMFS